MELLYPCLALSEDLNKIAIERYDGMLKSIKKQLTTELDWEHVASECTTPQEIVSTLKGKPRQTQNCGCPINISVRQGWRASPVATSKALNTQYSGCYIGTIEHHQRKMPLRYARTHSHN